MQDTQWSSEIVAKSWRRPLKVMHEEHQLDAADAQLLRLCLTMRSLLLADLCGNPSAGEVRNFVRTTLGLCDLRVEHYAGDWAALKEWLLAHAEEINQRGTVGCLSDFKHLMRRQIRYKWIYTATLGLMEQGVSFDSLLQWIVFDEKVNLSSLDLRTKYRDDYLRTEEEIRGYCYDLPADLIAISSSSARRFSPGLYPFRPGHGPGATAELRRSQATPRNKNEVLTMDTTVSEYLHWRYASEDDDNAGWFMSRYSDVPRTCELVCVPKSMTKNRTISKEPTTLQYLQQDLFRALDDWISSDSLLRYHIDLHDQALSRDLARKGSEFGRFSTIDLSKASDLVTLPLLRQLIPDSALLEAIEWTRSTHCLVDDETKVEILKVAGMGNAICFPTECIVFAWCCECACRRVGLVDTRRCYRVFGDDIVICDEAVDALFEILEACHFQVNREKSFYHGSSACFREACGIWAFGGRDVTPLRLSRRLAVSIPDDREQTMSLTVPQSAGWVDLSNDTLRRGFYRLNRGIHAILSAYDWYYSVYRVGWFAERAEGASGFPMPYFLTLDANATQWNVRERWNRSLQRTEVRCRVYHAEPKEPPKDDNDLLSWWTLASRRPSREEREIDREIETVIGSDFRSNHGAGGTAGTSPLSWRWKWVERLP